MTVISDDLPRLCREQLRLKRRLASFSHDHRAKERAIHTDETLTEQQKSAKVKLLEEESRRQRMKLVRQLEEISGEIAEAEKQTREQYPVDPAKLQLLRGMLERKVAWQTIIERALENGDREMLHAAMAELRYFGSEDGFADTRETMLAIDRALAEIGDPEHRATHKALVDIAQVTDGLDTVVEVAGKTSIGAAELGLDTLRLGYALAGDPGGVESGIGTNPSRGGQ